MCWESLCVSSVSAPRPLQFADLALNTEKTLLLKTDASQQSRPFENRSTQRARRITTPCDFSVISATSCSKQTYLAQSRPFENRSKQRARRITTPCDFSVISATSCSKKTYLNRSKQWARRTTIFCNEDLFPLSARMREISSSEPPNARCKRTTVSPPLQLLWVCQFDQVLIAANIETTVGGTWTAEDRLGQIQLRNDNSLVGFRLHDERRS